LGQADLRSVLIILLLFGCFAFLKCLVILGFVFSSSDDLRIVLSEEHIKQYTTNKRGSTKDDHSNRTAPGDRCISAIFNAFGSHQNEVDYRVDNADDYICWHH